MKQINDKVTKRLTHMQAMLDKSGKRLFFSYPKQFLNLEALIKHAISYQPRIPQSFLPSENDKKYHQMIGSSRSMQDLYLLSKSYFPNTTLFDVRNVLQTFYDNNKLNMWFCGTFQKCMFRYENSYKIYNLMSKNWGFYEAN